MKEAWRGAGIENRVQDLVVLGKGIEKEELGQRISVLIKEMTDLVVTAGLEAANKFGPGRKRIDGWSPQAMKMLNELRAMTKVLRRWDRYWPWHKVRPSAIRMANIAAKSQAHIRVPEAHMDDRSIDEWMGSIRELAYQKGKALQGRKRREMRLKINFRVREREKLREKKKLKAYLNRMDHLAGYLRVYCRPPQAPPPPC